MISRVFFLFTASLVLFLPVLAMARVPPPPSDAEFQAWLSGFKKSAEKQGLAASDLDRLLANVRYIPRVIELDRRQPEFSLTFWQYLGKTISNKRIDRGRKLLKKHAELLSRVEGKYGVQPRFLVAFWGLESNFGDYTGTFPLIDSLATLSYDKRRRKFFSAQLIAALQIIAAGDISANVKASWAGAMGNTQFIPTTYRAHAIDFDGDGRRDLWKSLPDVFASSARFLARSGWDSARTWGREVSLPSNLDFSLTGLDKRKKLKQWSALGVKSAKGGPLPQVDIEASLVLPAGAKGPAFLVYKNFRTTMVWNRSIFYALAVGLLSDRLAGKDGLVARKPAGDKALSRSEAIEIQQLLTGAGFDAGGADGIIGRGTRKAIKAYQKANNLPPDGFADAQLLLRLRKESP